MKVIVLIALLAVCAFAQVTLTLSQVPFTIEYSITGDKINFVIEGINEGKGSVCFGVGGTEMTNLDVVQFIFRDSKIVAIDRTNIGSRSLIEDDTEIGGKNDWIVDAAESYYTPTIDEWKVSFSRKLVTGDVIGMDNDLVVGESTQFAIALFDDGFSFGKGKGVLGKHIKRERVSTCLIAVFFLLF